MRKITFFVLGIFCCGALEAQSGTRDLPHEWISMDADWRFSQTDTTGAAMEAFNDGGWRALNLPHDWSIESEFIQNAPTGGGGGYLPTGIGWYRKHFLVSASDARKKIRIQFDGVYQNSDVWINGQHLGHYPNGYMSFFYDLSPYIKKGVNVIAVRVDNSLQPNTRYYSGSGIYRHVWLHIADALHVAQWGIAITTPRVDSLSSVVVVRTRIENADMRARDAVLRSILLDAGGHEVARAASPISVPADSAVDLRQEINVVSASLWSLEKPNMYVIRSVIEEKGRTLDDQSTPFGIRDIRYDADKGFLLNGKRVKMNGVCLHHDAGCVGAAVPEAMWARRLQLLKDMGCNAIRTSHNPVAPEFLDLCDRMGFLVMDEFLDEWKSGKVKYGYSNYFDAWSQRDLVGFIHRDRNHPSVVMWSAGNEIGEQKQEKGVDVLRALLETFHREDSSRPVTTGNDNIAADGGSARLPFLDLLDIVGYNYVDRWHERRELFYSIDRHDHPGWKMVGTESVSIPGVRGNPANMAAVIRAEQLWKYVASHDYVIGDFMWTGIDYLGEARWPAKNASSGVIDLCGFPKDAFYFYQSQWTEKPMIHLAPHWNWKGREGQVIQVMAYTNCDSVELFVNGKSFGIKALEFPRQGNSGGWNRYPKPPVGSTTGDLHLVWDVPYEPGVLKAVGRKAGRVACEEELRTTGVAAAIRLTTERNGMVADGRDVAQVKAEVVDEHGLLVPDADNALQFSIEGPGSLIGLDNGDPRDHVSMKSSGRRVFHGLALAVIRSSGKPGVVMVRVSSPGLKEGTLDIVSGAGKTAIRQGGKVPGVMPGTDAAVMRSSEAVDERKGTAETMMPREILLWDDGAPGSEGRTGQEKVRIAETGDHVVSGVNRPSITPFVPAGAKANGVGAGCAAVIIAPGGGHAELWIDHEGYNPARFLQARGIAAFVLKYRLSREPGSTYTIDGNELADIQRAIRLVRSRAKEWGIDSARIGVMGFSAGGEIAGLSAMRFDAGRKDAGDAVERESSRPDFQALIYPGNSGRFETVKGSPPAFLAGGYKDRADIAEGLAKVYLKYKEAGIPAELHIYADAGHGFGMRATNKGAVAGWPERFVEWLGELGFLQGSPAAGVSRSVLSTGNAGIGMAWIGPGTFVMGSPDSEGGRKVDESPETQVTLTKGFWMGKTEVTIGQWKAVMGRGLREQVEAMLNDDSIYDFGGQQQRLRDFMRFDRHDPEKIMANEEDSLPMYFVSWNDAMAFCAALTSRERAAGRLPDGYVYDLPTEAQWEFACRAGTSGATFSGPMNIQEGKADVLEKISWYRGNSAEGYRGRGIGPSAAGPRGAGEKTGNAWGLQDMYGNLWEWCRDWYGAYPGGKVFDPMGPATGKGRVNRGGSWGSGAADERSANRASNPQPEKSAYRGFRIALVAEAGR